MGLTTSASNFIRLFIVPLSIALCSLPLHPQVTAQPWSAPPSTIVVAEQRLFQNGEVKLSGTLYLPTGTKPVPAVIAFHSASSATQDLPLYRHLKDLLPPLGYAVFIFDRRGNGKSGGSSSGNDFNTLANDGLAALRMLTSDKRIDPRKIGFWGLSQGGWLAVLAASLSRQVAFAISISAPLTTPDVQMNFAVRNILSVKGFPEHDIRDAISTRTFVDNFMRGRGDRATGEKLLAEVVKKPWFKYSFISPTLDDPARSQWAKEIRLDPVVTLNKVTCPLLILYGSDDPWVPARISAEILNKIAGRKPNLRYAVIAGANHEMATTITPEKELDPLYATAISPDAPSYFGILAKWLGLLQVR